LLPYYNLHNLFTISLTLHQLKKARFEAGLKQEDVANILKKPQSYISKIERGERRLDVMELKKIADIYKKPLNYFIK
jgi:transcriptional regulator with XRE-family HTH domain